MASLRLICVLRSVPGWGLKQEVSETLSIISTTRCQGRGGGARRAQMSLVKWPTTPTRTSSGAAPATCRNMKNLCESLFSFSPLMSHLTVLYRTRCRYNNYIF